MLASYSNDKKIRLWDVKSGSLKKTLNGHSDEVSTISYSPDGMVLASGSKDRTICLWDIKTGIIKQIIEGHSQAVVAVVYSPKGELLASASNDRSIRLWSTTTGKLIKILKGSVEGITKIVFSPCGAILASGSINGDVDLWNVSTGNLQKTFTTNYKGASRRVSSLIYSPSGLELAVLSDGMLHLWNTRNKKHTVLRRIIRTGHISKIMYHPDSSLSYVVGNTVYFFREELLYKSKLFNYYNKKNVLTALKLLWGMELDEEELIFKNRRNLLPIYDRDKPTHPLLIMPKPNELKLDQLMRWLELQTESAKKIRTINNNNIS